METVGTQSAREQATTYRPPIFWTLSIVRASIARVVLDPAVSMPTCHRSQGGDGRGGQKRWQSPARVGDCLP